MIDEEIKNKIKYLFSEKKYVQVIKEVEELTDPQERPSGLINLLGISYYLKKNPTKEDYYKSLNCFEISFIKEKNSIHGLNAIKNLVIVAVKSNYISEEFKIFLTKSKKLYLEAETYFGDNNEFLQTGINLFNFIR